MIYTGDRQGGFLKGLLSDVGEIVHIVYITAAILKLQATSRV